MNMTVSVSATVLGFSEFRISQSCYVEYADASPFFFWTCRQLWGKLRFYSSFCNTALLPLASPAAPQRASSHPGGTFPSTVTQFFQKTCRTFESSLLQDHTLPQVQPAHEILVWSAVALIVGYFPCIASYSQYRQLCKSWSYNKGIRYWQEDCNFVEEQQKRSRNCPYRLLYVAVIWICTAAACKQG